MEATAKQCPKCGSNSRQMKAGYNRSGTQRCMCGLCGKRYTQNPKAWRYSEEIRQLAVKEYFAGASGRGVGKIHGFSKANVFNWLKKTEHGVDKPSD